MDARPRSRGDLADRDDRGRDRASAELDRIYAPLQERVKERGLWAAHLPPELGGQGFGQVKLGLMNEILGTSIYAPNGVRLPGARLRQQRDPRARGARREQKERWLYPLLAGEMTSAFSMTEPETPGSDPTQLRTRAVRDGDGLRPQRAQVVHVERLDRGLPRSSWPSPTRTPRRTARLDVHRPGRRTGREPRARRAEHGAARAALRDARWPHRDPSTRTSGSAREALLGEEGDGFLIAQHRLVPGRIHHCMRWLGVARRAFDMLCERVALPAGSRRAASRQADGPELDRRLGGPDAGRAADDAARGVEDRHVSARVPRGTTCR